MKMDKNIVRKKKAGEFQGGRNYGLNNWYEEMG